MGQDQAQEKQWQNPTLGAIVGIEYYEVQFKHCSEPTDTRWHGCNMDHVFFAPLFHAVGRIKEYLPIIGFGYGAIFWTLENAREAMNQQRIQDERTSNNHIFRIVLKTHSLKVIE